MEMKLSSQFPPKLNTSGYKTHKEMLDIFSRQAMQTKTALRFHFSTVRMAKVSQQTAAPVGKVEERGGCSSVASGSVNLCSYKRSVLWFWGIRTSRWTSRFSYNTCGHILKGLYVSLPRNFPIRVRWWAGIGNSLDEWLREWWHIWALFSCLKWHRKIHR